MAADNGKMGKTLSISAEEEALFFRRWYVTQYFFRDNSRQITAGFIDILLIFAEKGTVEHETLSGLASFAIDFPGFIKTLSGTGQGKALLKKAPIAQQIEHYINEYHKNQDIQNAWHKVRNSYISANLGLQGKAIDYLDGSIFEDNSNPPNTVYEIIITPVAKPTITPTINDDAASNHDAAYFREWIVDTEHFQHYCKDSFIKALRNYSKGGPAGRFFLGAWDRTFGKEIDHILLRYDNGSLQFNDLVTELKAIEVEGKKPLQSTGAFARIRTLDINAYVSGSDIRKQWENEKANFIAQHPQNRSKPEFH